jgi:hypothetical protein
MLEDDFILTEIVIRDTKSKHTLEIEILGNNGVEIRELNLPTNRIFFNKAEEFKAGDRATCYVRIVQ